ncbi:hypothetical protein BC2230_40869 [Burkholderia cepacia]
MLIIAVAVLACSLVLSQAERRLKAQGKRLHRINAYLNGTIEPDADGRARCLAARAAGPVHGGRRLVGESPSAIGQLGGVLVRRHRGAACCRTRTRTCRVGSSGRELRPRRTRRHPRAGLRPH